LTRLHKLPKLGPFSDRNFQPKIAYSKILIYKLPLIIGGVVNTGYVVVSDPLPTGHVIQRNVQCGLIPLAEYRNEHHSVVLVYRAVKTAVHISLHVNSDILAHWKQQKS